MCAGHLCTYKRIVIHDRQNIGTYEMKVHKYMVDLKQIVIHSVTYRQDSGALIA